MIGNAHDIAFALLATRAPGATVCPSEIARAMATEENWRNAMPDVHAAIDRLLVDDLVRLSWKGEPLTERTGPYRISRGTGLGAKDP